MTQEKKLPKNVWLLVNHSKAPLLQQVPMKSNPDKMVNKPVAGKYKLVEQIFITTTLSNKKVTSASVIIEILNKKLVKSRLEKSAPEQVINYYLKQYVPEIKKFFKQYYNTDFLLSDE